MVAWLNNVTWIMHLSLYCIGIKFLQSILVKVCLILGIKVHPGISFDEIIEPKDRDSGWTVSTTPASTPISSYNFDVILAADGNRNSLPGFTSKVFRPKLALGVTVNFVNHNTTKECAVQELGGLNVLHCQKAFKALAMEHGINLENIVYFKDETHYFVMTALKQSLIQKGVLKEVRILMAVTLGLCFVESSCTFII